MILVLDQPALRGASGIARYRPEFAEAIEGSEDPKHCLRPVRRLGYLQGEGGENETRGSLPE